jgi:prepilin-type N-terminal cleavage/methylation domain-containing protein
MERTLMPSRSSPFSPSGCHRAFTLIELLVASAVFMVLLLLCSQIIDGSAGAVRVAERVGDTDQTASLVFELLNGDLESRVPLPRIPREWGGVAGNDPLAFYASRPGYDGDRGLSWVRYFIADGSQPGLHRAAEGLFVDPAGGRPLRVFNPGNLPAVAPDNEALISPQVFRMETTFMVRDDGEVRIESAPPVDADGFVETRRVAAVVVTLAILDSKVMPLLPGTASLAALAGRFPDAPAQADATLLAQWHAIAEDAPAMAAAASVPLPVAQGVRVFERVFRLP